MVMKKTKAEIIYDYGEDVANSIYTETGNYVGDADEDDEFYTNGSEYVEVDKAHRLLSFLTGISMLDAMGMWESFYEWLDLRKMFVNRIPITSEDEKKFILEYIAEDMEYYLEYLWEEYDAD